MEMVTVESSQIRSIGYDSESKEMRVQFSGGSIYRYDGIPEVVHTELMNAESIGKYFGQAIKAFPDLYPFQKIRGTDKEVAKELVMGASNEI